MPKYDAFGREIGEDTLSGLGGEKAAEPTPAPAAGWTEAQVAEAASSGAGAAPAARPAPAPRQPKPAPAPSFQIPDAPARVVRVRRRSGLGCLIALVVLAAVVAGPIVALFSLVDDAGKTDRRDHRRGRLRAGRRPGRARAARAGQAGLTAQPA